MFWTNLLCSLNVANYLDSSFNVYSEKQLKDIKILLTI